MTPPEIILSFIARQPKPIQENLYFVMCQPFRDDIEDDVAWPEVDLVKLAETVLSEKRGLSGFARTQFAIAAIDYHLDRPHDDPERAFEHMPEQAKESPALKKFYLGAPLRRKFYEAAQAEWLSLRQSALSFSALRVYERNLMVATMQNLRGI